MIKYIIVNNDDFILTKQFPMSIIGKLKFYLHSHTILLRRARSNINTKISN